LVGVAIEDEQGEVHVLPVVPVVGRALLLAVRGIIRPIQIEQHSRGRLPRCLVGESLSCVEGDGPERQRHPVAGRRPHRVLQPGEGGLARQVRSRLRQPPAHHFQQGVGAQRVRVVLVFVATGNLEHPLADQRLQRVAHRGGPVSPLGHHPSERATQPQHRIRFLQPG
jgi:hypothetical protein